jgi:hypothetical protein
MSQPSLTDALFAWANSNAQLTGRIKELALTEADDAGPTSVARQAALSATAEAISLVRTARSEVTRAYRDLHVEVPQEFHSSPSS